MGETEDSETEETETQTTPKKKKRKTPKAKKIKNKDLIAREIARINQNRSRNQDLQEELALIDMQIPGVTVGLHTEEQEQKKEVPKENPQCPKVSDAVPKSDKSETPCSESKEKKDAEQSALNNSETLPSESQQKSKEQEEKLQKHLKIRDFILNKKPKPAVLSVETLDPKIDLTKPKYPGSGGVDGKATTFLRPLPCADSGINRE